MMKRTKWVVAAMVVMVASMLLLGGCAGNQPTIGVVDPQKVMADSPKVKQMQEQLEAKVKELTAQMDKDKATMSADEFQKKQEAAYNEVFKMKQDLEKQFEDTMKKALDEVSKEKKMTVILYKNMVAGGGIDVTEDVIKKLQ